jgi:hydrogenase expression/formation protein HypE
MNARESLQLESGIESDLACLVDPVFRLIDGGVEVHCLRDLTRGGLASALIEIAESAGVQIHLEEARIPVRADVQGACELLGLDPVYVANEGRFVCFVPEKQAETALDLLLQSDLGRDACLIGHVEEGNGRVTIESRIGVDRILDMLSGDQLPRIC